MRFLNSLRVLVVLIAIGLAASFAKAQTDPNLALAAQPYSAYNAGNIDNVNLSNGALSVEIPLISYPQRGKLSLQFALVYVNGGDVWNGSSSSGFLQHGWTFIVKNVPTATGTIFPSSPYPDYYESVSISTPEGAIHEAAPLSANEWESADATGYHVTTTDYTFEGSPFGSTVTDADGIKYSGYNTSLGADLSSGSPFAWFERSFSPQTTQDTNGNEISVTLSGSPYDNTILGWTDSVSRSIPVPTTDSSMTGCPSGTYTALSWTPPGVASANGGNSTSTYPIEFCFAQVSETDPIGDYGPVPATYYAYNLVAVVLPNGKSWTFGYTGASSNNPNDLTSITFPTGGTVSYTWTGTTTGWYSCGYYSSLYYYIRSVATRELNPNDGVNPTGTWTYNYSSLPTSMTVEDPDGNYAQHTFTNVGGFCSPFETQAKYYQGSLSGTLLKTVNTAYSDSNPDLGAFGDVALNAVPTSTKTVWAATSQQSEVDPSYDTNPTFYDPIYSSSSTLIGSSFGGSYGRMLSKSEYDYGSGSTGALLRVTNTNYTAFSSSPYLTANLLNLPSSTIVEDGSSTVAQQTYYSYDESSYASSSCSSSTPCGELTTTTQYADSSHTLPTHTYYNGYGMPTSTKDPATNITSYSYDSTGVFLSGIDYPTTGSVTHTESFSHDSNTGLLTSDEDQNSQTTSYIYDDMLRTTEVDYPDGGQTKYCYTDTGGGTCSLASSPPYAVVITQKISSSSNKTSTAVVSGLGQLLQTQINSNPAGTVYTDYRYDDSGRQYSVSNPHLSSGSYTDGTTYTYYDALSRATSVAEQDGSTVSTSYSGSCATVTDPASKSRKSCTDGLGRMTGVWEDPSSSNYETDYRYDPLDDLTCVAENTSSFTSCSSASSTWRPRTFVYDWLGRLTSATNPESGTTSYSYTSSGSPCAGDTSAVCVRTDARSITTGYGYDAMSRLTSKTYSDGTPQAQFYYDWTAADGFTLANTRGRLSIEQSVQGSTALAISVFSYDSMGRVVLRGQCTPPICGTAAWSTSNGVYNGLGELASFTLPIGPTITRSYDAAGQLTQVSSDFSDGLHPGTLATINSHWPNGAIDNVSLGNGLAENMVYEPRQQPCRLTLYSSGTAPATCLDSAPSGNIQDFGYVYGTWGSTNNGNVTAWAGTGAQGFYRSYTYDALNRLSSLSDSITSNPCPGLTWSYDAWGNRTAQTVTSGTCGSWSTPYYSSNQVNNPDFTYDAAGNLTWNGYYTYMYDAENHMIQVDGTLGDCSTASSCYTYDALGNRAEMVVGGAATEYVYDLEGNVAVDIPWGVSYWGNSYLYMNGSLFAEYTPGWWLMPNTSNTYFIFQDHLGSTRLVTDVSGSTVDSMGFAPFGEQIAGGSTTTHQFTSYIRDANLDNANARYYSWAAGSFFSPDPGNAGADPTNPQTWNGYSYVLNNPLGLIDPTGLCKNAVYQGDLNFTAANDPCSDPSSSGTAGDGQFHCTNSDCTTAIDDGITVTDDSCHMSNAMCQSQLGQLQGQLQPPPQSQLSCAVTYGQNHSVAALFGAQNNFFGNMFGGNTVSGLVDLGQTIFGSKTPTARSAATAVLSGGGQGLPGRGPGFKGAAGQASDAVVSGAVAAGYNAATGVGQQTLELGVTASGKIASVAAPLAESTVGAIVSDINIAKIALDAGTFAYGAIFACRQ